MALAKPAIRTELVLSVVIVMAARRIAAHVASVRRWCSHQDSTDVREPEGGGRASALANRGDDCTAAAAAQAVVAARDSDVVRLHRRWRWGRGRQRWSGLADALVACTAGIYQVWIYRSIPGVGIEDEPGVTIETARRPICHRRPIVKNRCVAGGEPRGSKQEGEGRAFALAARCDPLSTGASGLDVVDTCDGDIAGRERRRGRRRGQAEALVGGRASCMCAAAAIEMKMCTVPAARWVVAAPYEAAAGTLSIHRRVVEP